MSSAWPKLRDGHAADDALLAVRAQILLLAALQRVDPGAVVRRDTFAGLDCIVAQPATADLTILYAHGGGFRIGGVEVWAGFASRLATVTNGRVIVPEYPLAPEYPFPHALDALAPLYRDIAGPVVLAGDSAGGGLVTSLALAAVARGWPAPRALILFSPWVDLTLDAASFVACAETDPFFSRAAAEEARGHYLAGADPAHPLASPLGGALEKLPPTWVCTSTSEVLRDDALTLARRLAERGGHVELRVEPDLPHVWPIIQPDAEPTEAAIISAGAFARRWTR